MLQVLKKQYKNKGLKNIILSISVCFFIFPVLATSVFSQDSELEKSVYKPKTPAKKSSPSKSKRSTNKKSNSKKKNQVSNKRSAPRTENKSTRKNNRNILVTFVTSTPKQEIWSGDKKLGITNDEALLEKWMKRGKYILTVKNNEGDLLVKSKLVDIQPKNNKFSLVEEKPAEEPKPVVATVEEELNKDLKKSVEATDNVKSILARYIDPLKTGTVTTNDWEYVYQTVKNNKLVNFTNGQIEAQEWFSSGQIELSKGNFKNAMVAFLKSANNLPDADYPQYGLGLAYLANKQIPEAITAFQKTIQLNPAFALAHRKLGDIYFANDKSKESIYHYQLAIQNGFQTPAVRSDLARVYIKEKRREEAIKELEAIAEVAPGVDVYLSLGDQYLDLKREISAYEAYLKATQISPDSAPAFYKLGDILYGAKEFERSKEAFEKALTLDEKGRQINVLLARKFVREAASKINK